MDPADKHPHRLENFKAWQLARTLAARTFRATQHKGFKDYPELLEAIRKEACDIPGQLAYGRHAAVDACEEGWLYESALGSCLRLQSLLALASDLDLLESADGSALYEGCESTRRIIMAVINSNPSSEADDTPPKPLIKPSGSPGPARRPPASGGGSRGGDSWGSRS